MKENAEGKNERDKNEFKQRAACVCITKSRPNCTLLVSSSRNPRHFVVPGGGVENEETNEDAALRELEEESGLRGNIIKSLGMFKNEDRKHCTEVFLVEVVEELDNWLESDRTRKWMNFDEAFKKLSLYKPYQCEYLKRIQYLTEVKSK